MKPPSFDTSAVHAGSRRIEGAVTTPVFRSSSYEFSDGSYHDQGYIRLSNTPNHAVTAAKLADLEGAQSACLFSSGMGAISTTVFALLSPGDAILAHRTLYGGTLAFFRREARRFGIATIPFDAANSATWPEPPPSVRLIWVETISNPLMEVADLENLVEYAKQHGLILIVDNTFASPMNCRPIELGVDVVVESCSKYLNGHTDIVGGVAAGEAQIIRRIKETSDHLGACMDPQVAWLLERGLKTLPVRMARHNSSAWRIARALEDDHRVPAVRYSGLPSHPDHDRATKLLKGFGGMISIELSDPGEVDRFLRALRTVTVAVSLGGVESLAMCPGQANRTEEVAATTHAASHVPATLVRFSIGLEDPDDLLEDVDRALNEMAGDQNAYVAAEEGGTVGGS